MNIRNYLLKPITFQETFFCKNTNSVNTTKPNVVFRSQITPDMTFTLAPGEKPTPVKVESTASGKISEWILKHIVKPEVEIEASGYKQNYSPYGRPQDNYILPLVASVGVGALLFAGVIFTIGRVSKKNKTKAISKD